jgi:hypothetical protein
MSSLLVFNRVYRLEIQSVSHVGVFDPSCELVPLYKLPYVFDQIRNLQHCYTTTPGGLRQINTGRQVPLYRSIFKKSGHLGFSVFIVIWSMQCCGSGSGIRCLFDPWIRDPGSEIGFFRIPDPKSIYLRAY